MRLFLLTLVCSFIFHALYASPRIESNSLADRHDLLLIRDSDVVDTAVLTWPWPIGRTEIDHLGLDNEARQQSQVRIGRAYRRAGILGTRPPQASIAFGTDRQPFRSFGYQPREELEATVASSWLGEWTAGNLQLTIVEDPSDGDEIRLDGTYLSVAVGNWFLSIDQVERWWGPGWDGSLLLSNNARPIPAISLTRIAPIPFERAPLSWIGPWTFTTFMGQLDNDEGDRPGSDALLFGMRIDYSPFGWDWIDIGLNRTGQWAGDSRPKNLDTFWRLFIGEDNRVGGVTAENEPGNQLAGVDYRWKIKEWRFAHYGQLVGEDEESFLPDANMLLFGVEHWGEMKRLSASWRIYYEWADTRAGHLVADPRPNRAFNIAYNHGIYQTGYRYKGRSIGHAIDGDGFMRSIGVLVSQDNGNFYTFKYRNYAINRDGAGRHSVSLDALDGTSIELSGNLAMPQTDSPDFRFQMGIHYIDETNLRTGDSDTDLGGSIRISKGF